MLAKLRRTATLLKAETFALFLAVKDPRTPLAAKLLVAAIVAYAVSPIDLIPDVIPILGWLDDLIILPWGIRLALKMVPEEVMAECRQRASSGLSGLKKAGLIAAAVIILLWVTLVCLLGSLLYSAFN
ncbi:YkvA family protein [Pokkaliibacter sp. CJK22405]|uniref:YkvA family protein n=1 Tax=Pokkaliibacter sp. CJK22405 TaxID=3384615 RepID=UPI0039849085